MVGKINIIGSIGKFEGEKSVELIDVITQAKKQPNATSFEVTINSDGGIVTVGYDIYHFLKSLGVPITTIGSGTVASIATVIFMAGSKRIVKPNTKFMIHLPMIGMDYSNSLEVEIGLKALKEVENAAVNFYAKELGLSKEAIYPLLRNETFLSQDELIGLGFVTTESNFRIAARLNIKTKTNKMSKPSKLRAILNILKGEVVNKVVYTADNKELVFPDLTEDDPIEVGAIATFDGQAADGEITTAEGKIYVFEAGVLMEIKEIESEEEVSDEEIVEVLQDLQASNESLKNENEALKVVIAKLKGTSKTVETDKTDKTEKKNTVSDVVAQWKSNRKKIKK